MLDTFAKANEINPATKVDLHFFGEKVNSVSAKVLPNSLAGQVGGYAMNG